MAHYLQVKTPFVSCGPQNPGKSDRGTSGQTKPEGRDSLGLHIRDLGLKQGTKPFVHFPKKNYE